MIKLFWSVNLCVILIKFALGLIPKKLVTITTLFIFPREETALFIISITIQFVLLFHKDSTLHSFLTLSILQFVFLLQFEIIINLIVRVTKNFFILDTYRLFTGDFFQ